jgi:hypothetical protein
MPEALQIVASLFTIWAQSSVLAENKEFDRFKEPEAQQEQTTEEVEKRRVEVLTASLEDRYYILSQTNLGD